MARSGLLILAAYLLMGCGTSPVSTKIEIPVEPLKPDVVVKSRSDTIEPKPLLYLCIISAPQGWPVEQSMNNWNANGKNLFTLNLQEKCRDTVAFKLIDSNKVEGETEFKPTGIEVRLNRKTRVKLHTLCHELGHVLGLPHNNDAQSCMNISMTKTTPSALDLEKVAEKYWIKEESARHAVGQ